MGARAHRRGKRGWESPKKPWGEEDENAGEGAQARRRVIHLDIEQIFLQLHHLAADSTHHKQSNKRARTSLRGPTPTPA